jgi:hypothetical protein
MGLRVAVCWGGGLGRFFFWVGVSGWGNSGRKNWGSPTFHVSTPAPPTSAPIVSILAKRLNDEVVAIMFLQIMKLSPNPLIF